MDIDIEYRIWREYFSKDGKTTTASRSPDPIQEKLQAQPAVDIE